MSVAKDKKRIMITLDERTIAIMEEFKSQNVKELKTFSQIVNAAVIYMYLVLNGYTNNNAKEEN